MFQVLHGSRQFRFEIEPGRLDAQQRGLSFVELVLDGALVILEPVQLIAVRRRILGELDLVGAGGLKVSCQASKTLVDHAGLEFKIAPLQALRLDLSIKAFKRLLVLLAERGEGPAFSLNCREPCARLGHGPEGCLAALRCEVQILFDGGHCSTALVAPDL